MRWDDPDVEQVVDGVWRTPVPLPNDGLRAVNVYVVADGDGVTLVDAGWDGPEAWAAVQRGLAAAGAGVGDVRGMLITHIHYDHHAQATPLRRAGAGGYWLGEGDRGTFTHQVTDPRAAFLQRMDALEQHGAVALAEGGRRRGGMTSEPRDWDPPDRWAVDGDRWHTADGELTAVATPGHTRGHLCFHHQDRRLLFAGDHVLPHITPSIGVESDTSPMALAHFLSSLARVATLEADLVLPAHGPVFDDLPGRVDALLAHHDDRFAACLAAVSPGGSTAHKVATRLGWTRRQTPFDELDGFNQVLAVWETAAHLEVLTARGTLERTVGQPEDGRPGTIRFRPHPARSS